MRTILMEVTAIKHKHISGKDMYYIKFNNGKEEHHINVGIKNYKKIDEMTKLGEYLGTQPFSKELKNKK